MSQFMCVAIGCKYHVPMQQAVWSLLRQHHLHVCNVLHVFVVLCDLEAGVRERRDG